MYNSQISNKTDVKRKNTEKEQEVGWKGGRETARQRQRKEHEFGRESDS